LTSNSIATQWINQEIGFATALGIRIMSIVESNLIDKLKGFIHKQIDLPYNYQPNIKRAIEHKEFIKQVRKLITDLEKDFQNLIITEEPHEKSDFEKSLELADKSNEELEFQRQRKLFLNSTEGVAAAKSEVLKCFTT
jgi:hypothetical protein